MTHTNPPQLFDGGGYDVPPRDSYVIGMALKGGEYVPNRVVDVFGIEWAKHWDHSRLYVGWLPTGRLVPSKIQHEWGAVIHERG